MANNAFGSVYDKVITARRFVGMAIASVASHKSSRVANVAYMASKELIVLYRAKPALFCGAGWHVNGVVGMVPSVTVEVLGVGGSILWVWYT